MKAIPLPKFQVQFDDPSDGWRTLDGAEQEAEAMRKASVMVKDIVVRGYTVKQAEEMVRVIEE